MLTRSQTTSFEIKDGRRLCFYAAVFNQPTTITEKGRTFTETIAPGAFAASIASRSTVVANIDHKEAKTFASFPDGGLLLQEDGFGLFCSCWLPDDANGNAALALVESGQRLGSSFRMVSKSVEDTGTTIKRTVVELVDVCLTTRPAYPQTVGEVQVRTAPVNISLLRSQYALLKHNMKK